MRKTIKRLQYFDNNTPPRCAYQRLRGTFYSNDLSTSRNNNKRDDRKENQKNMQEKDPAYAIVNSAVSASTIQLYANVEFQSYHYTRIQCYDPHVIDNIARWSETIIFQAH